MTSRSEQLKAEAKKAFANHQIKSVYHDNLGFECRWLLQQKFEGEWSWIFATEIISLAGGKLYVGGDIEHCIFAYYSPRPNDPQPHKSKVRWMGQCKDIEYYVAQKVTIGTGHQLTEVYEPEEAKKYLKDYLMDIPEDERDTDQYRNLQEVLCDDSAFEAFEVLMLHLYEADSSYATDCGNSMLVTAPRVYYCHAALSRLCELWGS